MTSNAENQSRIAAWRARSSPRLAARSRELGNFLNHMPNNAVNWITTRNYGFSDGADLFVFISGYTAALVFGRMIRDHGFVIGATRLWKRVWQLYLAHDMVLVIYVAIVGFVAWRFQFDSLVHQFNVARLIDDPFRFAGKFCSAWELGPRWMELR